MYTLQHFNFSSYFAPGAQRALREKAATWCRGNFEHSRHSPSPKQKVLNGSPKGLEQDYQGCKSSWLPGRKPEGSLSRKERSLLFWKAEVNLLQFSLCDGRLQQSFWWKTALLFSFFWNFTLVYSRLPSSFPRIQRSGDITNIFSFSKISWETEDIDSNKAQQLLSLFSVMIRIQSLTLSFLKGYLLSVMCLEILF